MSNEEEKAGIFKILKNKLKIINVNLTPKEEFDKKYKYYKESWKKLVENG